MARTLQPARGVVVQYDTERGFGFIRSNAYPEDVFAHVSAIRGQTGPRGLSPGQRVLFEAEPDARGPRAVWVEPRPASWRDLTPGQTATLALGILVAVGAFLLGGLGGVPWLAAILVPLNLATLGVFALDKHRATRDGRRVPEGFLLGLALLGGSPAAVLGMVLTRHKTRKHSFLAAMIAIVVVQIVALVVGWSVG